MNDIFQRLGHSLVHHGRTSNRIYLMIFNWNDQNMLLQELNMLALEKKYTKIIAKVPARAIPLFLADDYQVEANIPGFFNGNEDLFFMAKYFSTSRRSKPRLTDFAAQIAQERCEMNKNPLNPTFTVSKLDPSFAGEIAGIYQKVFATYPFPIHQPEYILKTIKEGSVHYYGVIKNHKLVGLSSSEIDYPSQNAEMTDFAVLPECRGHHLAYFLLDTMEQDMKGLGIKTVYTIARLNSAGMNKTFLRAGYQYTGLLVNNTNISGKIESMNVYYKPLEI